MVADLDDTETTEMLIQRVQTYQDALGRLLRVVREHASTEASAGSVRAALRNFDDETKRLNAVTSKKPAKKPRKKS
jgi:hypothetical protein